MGERKRFAEFKREGVQLLDSGNRPPQRLPANSAFPPSGCTGRISCTCWCGLHTMDNCLGIALRQAGWPTCHPIPRHEVSSPR